MKQLSSNGIDWAYDDRGSGSAVLLVHGFPLDRRVWQPVADQLAERCRVVTLDLRGFGQTPLGEEFSIPSLADDLAAVAKALGLTQFVLAGLSMGGYVALAYASRYESTLAGLSLIDTKAEADNPQQKLTRDKMIDLVRTSGSKAIADDMLGKMISEQTIRTAPQTVRQLRGIMEACPPKTIETALAAMRDRPSYVGLLSSLKVPLQVIVGEKDEITPPAVAKTVAAEATDADLTIIPNAGHMSPLEQPALVAAAIEGFVTRVAAGQ